MQNKSFSLWNLVVLSFFTFLFVFALPAYLNVHLLDNKVEFLVEEYNNDAKVMDEFNHVFVNENLKEHLPYDYELLEDLYERLQLDPGDTIDNYRISHTPLWDRYHTSVVVNFLTDRYVNGLFKGYTNIIYNLFLSLVILGIIISSILSKMDSYLFFKNKDPLEPLRKILGGSEVKLSFVILGIAAISFVVSLYIFSLPLLKNSFSTKLYFGIPFMFLFTGIVVGLYLCYLILNKISENEGWRYASAIDMATVILILSLFLMVFRGTIGMSKGIISQAYNSLIYYRFLPFAGFERFLGFGLLVIFITLTLAAAVYFIFRMIYPGKGKFRLAYLLKYLVLILALMGCFKVLQTQTNVFNDMIEKHYKNSRRSNLTHEPCKLTAEVYQWYNQQKDIQGDTSELPEEFTSHLKDRDDFDFSYSWDGINLESKLEYVQLNEESKTLTYNLNAETGDINVQGIEDKKVKD